MAKQKMMAKTFTIQQLVSWYASNVRIQPSVYVAEFNACSSNVDRAKKLLIGSHQWYLRSYMHAQCQILLKKIETLKPWNHSMSSFKDFEDVYKWVGSWLQSSGIRQLTIYDVALRIVLITNYSHLLPQNNLYVHALPLFAYKWVCTKEKTLPHISKNSAILFSTVKKIFYPLNPWETEDFLCHVGKAIKAIQKNKNKTLKQITGTNILNQLQHPSQKKLNTKSCLGNASYSRDL